MVRGWGILLYLVSSDAFSGHMFAHTFKFPHVSYDQGIRQIHTPENLACHRPLIVPGFMLFDVKSPTVVQGYSTITFCFTTILGDVHARMMTNSKSCSHVLLSALDSNINRGTPTCMLHMDVSREGTRGHAVTIRGHVLCDTPILARVLSCMVLRQDAWEAAMQWGYTMGYEIPQLQMYRANVLFQDQIDGVVG